MRWNLARGSRWTRPIVGIRVQGNPIARRPHFLKDLNDGSDLAQVTLWACVGPASGSSPASLPSAHPAACGPSRDLVSKGPGSGQPYSAAASQAAAAWVNPVKPQTLLLMFLKGAPGPCRGGRARGRVDVFLIAV
jgi:hypothetical protein